MKKENFGIVLIRLSGIPSEEKAEIVLNAIENHIEEMKYSFSVYSKRFRFVKKV